ncbi:MAG: FAD-dependent oxidoreductase, partial [Candidatus Nanopelagicales bacterium]
MEHEADVIIVGAGLSGLIAAQEVIKAGRTPLILEANDRVGGRILTEEVMPGVPLELGAQWIGDTHHRMFELAAELGVETYSQFEDGETTYEINGPVMREAEFHSKNEADLAGLRAVLDKLDELSQQVDVESPWLSSQAAEWDAITAGTWLDSQGLGPIARTMIEICSVGILAVPTHEVSFLDLLYNVQVCGVTSELLAESEGGAQTTRFVGGTSEIPLRLVEKIGNPVIFDAQVQTIEYSNDSVKVICRNGVVARGRQVIVALAPTLAGRITYDPPLPGVRDQLTQRMPQASAVKVFA